MKTKLKELCYSQIKGKLLSGKINKLDSLIIKLGRLDEMDDIDNIYLRQIKKQLKGDKKDQFNDFFNALMSGKC